MRGIALDGRADWIFAPLGWDAASLERRFPFSGRPGAGNRRALIRPSQLVELVGEFGERPCVDLPAPYALSRLMRRNMLAVEILIARVPPSGGLGHSAVA
ncbi:hypothetical protein GCM10023144_39860 [Pigmentiphaga soli]|uniref:Uncharacterized protein n=1 Tax=Pigmentiphaga soli TaxID=1007095 RepID=A0ABP8HK66_9BURK